MPSSTQRYQTKLQYSDDDCSIQSLTETESYITNSHEFLSEKNYVKALTYWLNHHCNTDQISNVIDLVNSIQLSISNIDNLINNQLNIIIHNDKFQKIEASWRGLVLLVEEAKENKNVKIKVLDITWHDIVKDINRALEFDQSYLFQLIYNDEYGIAGGEPFGVIIGDYEISHQISKQHPHDDLLTLEGIAEISAAAFTPFIANASPQLFGLDKFTELESTVDLQNIFSQSEYIKWHRLRDKTDTRFIGLTAPRILTRQPYNTKPSFHKGIFFYETSSHSCNDNYLWMNSCYGFASILIREFINVGWFGHIRGVVRNHIGGGLLSNTPVEYFKSDKGKVWNKPITDTVITDTLEKELSDIGLIPLCQCYNSPFAAFYNNQSIHKPQLNKSKEQNVNAKLSVMLQHILCGSRIVHYIKVIFRDKIGSFQTSQSVEEYIQHWLHKYTTGREDLEWEEQARYPLREASVKVKDHPEKPGQFLCVIHIKPHYQLDQMVSELELATELLKSG